MSFWNIIFLETVFATDLLDDIIDDRINLIQKIWLNFKEYNFDVNTYDHVHCTYELYHIHICHMNLVQYLLLIFM